MKHNKTNIPEMEIEGINFIFGVGGEYKKNSSSWILKNKSEKRVWGKLFNLFHSLILNSFNWLLYNTISHLN